MDYFTDALRKYADFTGRATRTQYWMYVLIYLIIYFVLAIIDGVLGSVMLTGLFGLAMLIPNLSIGARRLHDTGRSGWWQLLLLIPLIGLIVVIVFFVMESQGDNEYGPKPSLDS